MKNLHLLPTDKPGRLFKLAGDLYLDSEMVSDHKRNIHIYITSDEFIEDGDFGLNLSTKNIVQYDGIKGLDSYYKKIILTTDLDLIADGVQAIDDEFLEWFVANPSCEWVEVMKEYKDGYGNWYNYQDDFKFTGLSIRYKIIIPQEEPKQESLTYTESAKKEERIFNSSMMKQETPEEASERIYDDNLFDYEKYRDGFMVGTKWQAERSYSEEEVMNIIDSFIDNLQDYTPTFNSRREWFKQFKKK
jgi:hypothetical protein